MENCSSVKPDMSYYKVDRKSLLNFKPLNRRLSSHYLNYDYTTEEFYKVAHQYLINNFYSLFNYVSNEYTPNLSVKFDTFTSSNGNFNNIIQLGTKVLAQEEFTQDLKVDVLYAIMLHEMFHKRITNADIMNAYMKNISLADYYESEVTKKTWIKLFPSHLMGYIFNVLEDYRIEKLGLRDFPGYVFFFDRLREYAIELHKGKIINQNLLANLILDYLMFKILLPELLSSFMMFIDDTYVGLKNPTHSKKNILDVVSNIDNYINRNLHLVYSDNIIDVVNATSAIHSLIPLKIQKELNKDIETVGKSFGGVAENHFFDSDKKIEEGYESSKDETEKCIFEAIENEENSRTGIKSKEDEVPKSRKEKIEVISVANKIYDNYTIYNPKCKRIDKQIYDEALKMSHNISKNLGFLSSRLNQINQNYELSEGDLDEDELYSISYSNNIFYDEESKAGFDFDIGILLDESGSMGEKSKMRNAKIAALSCILSMKESRHVNLFVYGHSHNRHHNDDGNVEMYEYFNSKRRITDWKNVFMATAKGNNADGYAIAKLGEIMMKDSKSANKIMIVISDGYPSAKNYTGELAEKHVKNVVEILEKKGIEIIQICIDNIERSNYMFKNFIAYDSMGNFIKKFREILQKKLNQFSEDL